MKRRKDEAQDSEARIEKPAGGVRGAAYHDALAMLFPHEYCTKPHDSLKISHLRAGTQRAAQVTGFGRAVWRFREILKIAIER